MRVIFLVGGISGFVLAGVSSWLADCGAGRIFLDSACGCLAGALLFRWFWTVLVRGFRETLEARQKAAIAADAKAKT